MAANLANVGFAAEPGAELEALARKCHQNGRASRCKHGTYIVWTPGLGIELWAQLNPREELIGLNAHFSGKTRLSAGLTERVARGGFPMDGGFRALAQPYGSDPIRGAFPFVFDCPDFLLHEELALPVIRSIQLAAFAQQCAVYGSEAEFRARAAKLGVNTAPDALVPLGMLDKERRPVAEPLASAMICAPVLEAAELTNPFAKKKFWWMRVKTSAGEADVVAVPELLPRAPAAGLFLQCTAWLSGRLA